ncbi:MAG TPA: ABC transporter permease [Vicinamibacterales bacterium]
MSDRPLIQLTLARLREFVREPEALFWAFVFPVVMSVVMAVAFPARGNSPVVIGIAAGAEAAGVRAALAAEPAITVRDVAPGSEQRALREGEVHLIVVPTMPPAYRFDPGRVESRTARLLVDDALKRGAGRTDPWTATEEPQQIPGSRYIDWLIPGLVGLGIMSTSMWGIGFSVAQSRMRKVLKLLVATPMRRRDYLGAQMLARLVFLAPEVAVPVAFGVYVLSMPMRGSVTALVIVSVIGALAFGALGLFVASRARTFEAISGLMNVSMLPMWLLSGVFFSAANFPATVQPVIQALPLTALNDALRAVVLEAVTLRGIQAELWTLMAWGIGSFAVALRIFRWR